MKMLRRCAAVLIVGGLLATTAQAAGPKSQPAAGGMTLGLGLGGGYGAVQYSCGSGQCEESGLLRVVSLRSNLFLGPLTLGARLMQDLEQRESPREVAALIGLRIGNSPVSLMVGGGRVTNADDDAPARISVTSWEILIAPRGRHLQYIVHGAEGDAEYAAFSIGFVLGNQ